MCSLIVKFSLGNEVRSLGSLRASDTSVGALKASAARCFKMKNAKEFDKFALQYSDDEGDMIRISNNQDVEEAFSLYADAGKTEIVIAIVNASAADFGFELVDDEFSGKNPSVVNTSHVVANPPLPEKVVEKVVEYKQVVEYKNHPLMHQLLAEFVEHVTIPDRSSHPANTRIRKTWRMLNNGACAWPEGCILSFTNGDESFRAREFITSSIQPGTEVDVTIDLSTPSRSGRYTAFYRLSDPSGKKAFGPHVWVDILVNNSSSVSVSEEKKPAEVVVVVPVEDKPTKVDCPQTFGKYNAGMLQLWNMGYKDTGRNLYLLDKYNGDTQSVVLFLIEHQTQ